MVAKKLSYDGNETTTNAEPDNFPFCVFVPYPKAPRRYQSFCVEATKEILRFPFRLFRLPFDIYPTIARSHFFRPRLPGWSALLLCFFKMRNTDKTSQFLTSLPGNANRSHLEGHIWRRLKSPDGSQSKGSRVDFDRSRLTCQKCPYTKTS
jgi:hypothetical protein